MSDIKPEKKCHVCQVFKPIENYTSTSRMCRDCRRVHDKSRPDRVSRNKRDPAKERACKRKWKAVNFDAIKVGARTAVVRAIKRGDLERKTNCETCGNAPVRRDGVTAVQAHHDDYSMPLSVRFLCAQCHTKWHKENDAAIAKEKQP